MSDWIGRLRPGGRRVGGEEDVDPLRPHERPHLCSSYRPTRMARKTCSCTDGLCTHEQVHLADGLVDGGHHRMPAPQRGVLSYKTQRGAAHPPAVRRAGHATPRPCRRGRDLEVQGLRWGSGSRLSPSSGQPRGRGVGAAIAWQRPQAAPPRELSARSRPSYARSAPPSRRGRRPQRRSGHARRPAAINAAALARSAAIDGLVERRR